MVKAPSSHGLERKFKPWRKGKSGKSNNASLKQQLRGLRRLYEKKKEAEGDEQQLEELQGKMNALQEQLQQREITEKERTNAKKSHKMRFLERQRLTRHYKHLSKQQPSTDAIERELWKLALDQVYVAHYPLDQTSYLSLYHSNDGSRRSSGQSSKRILFKMAQQRKRVLETLSAKPHASWIHPDQYERIKDVTTWSTEKERATFCTVGDDSDQQHAGATGVSDGRFQVSDVAQKVLEQQEKIEKQVDEEFAQAAAAEENSDCVNSDIEAGPCLTESKTADEKAQDDSDSDSSSLGSSDNVDEAVSVTESKAAAAKRPVQDSYSSSDSSSDDNEHKMDTNRKQQVKNDKVESNDSSSSSSSSESSDDDNEEPMHSTAASKQVPTNDDYVDDFLVAAADTTDVFGNAKRHDARDEAKGDKSEGWATQRQRPGQYQKKQRRR